MLTLQSICWDAIIDRSTDWKAMASEYTVTNLLFLSISLALGYSEGQCELLLLPEFLLALGGWSLNTSRMKPIINSVWVQKRYQIKRRPMK